MKQSLRTIAAIALLGSLAACAGQETQSGSLFAAGTSSSIDMAGLNALAHPWTAAGLPDEDSRAFVLAVDPAAGKSATVKLPTGNSGVLAYGDPDASGCKSLTMIADFRGTDAKAREGERVGAVLCPPSLFGSWTASTVTETAQAHFVAPRVAALPPVSPLQKRPPARTTRSSRNAAQNPGQNAPLADSQGPKPTETELAPVASLGAATGPEPAKPAAADPATAAPAAAPVVAAAAPPIPAPAPAASPVAPPPAAAKKADPAPWKPSVQTDL